MRYPAMTEEKWQKLQKTEFIRIYKLYELTVHFAAGCWGAFSI